MKSLIFLVIILVGATSFSAKVKAQKTDSVAALIENNLILVEGGSFNMGRINGLNNEMPLHAVTLKSFYMGKYEVTQALGKQVMGDEPSGFKGCPNCPVEQVSPKRIALFISKLNALTGKKFRLPTEAEWEYAAMGGNKSKGFKYSGSDNLDEVGWVQTNANGRTHPVGEKKPNELGLYDMAGNVWELCSDWYRKTFYNKCRQADPLNQHAALFHVVRGGSWRSPAERCYSKARNRNITDHHKKNGGFRVVVDI